MFNQPFGKIKKIHFIGIGGIGMSAIAKIILEMGYIVSGSDMKNSDILKSLQKKGADVFIGHKRQNIKTDVEVVVTSSAISPANAEILETKDRKLPLIKRGEMLAEIMRLNHGITIAGTHGKTTTTALVSAIFQAAGLSPTSVIGGNWFGINSNATIGAPPPLSTNAPTQKHYFICESDESDGSFLKLSPILSAVTNIDLDHMDHYGSKENLFLHFIEFINKTPFYGKCFVCLEDPNLKNLVEKFEKPFATYGFSTTHDIYAKNIQYLESHCTYELVAASKKGQKKKNLGIFQLNMLGKHNILNSLAAVGLALEVGIHTNSIKQAFKEFKGIDRRMSKLGTWKGFEIIDDYGHHPTEIQATLIALRNSLQKKSSPDTQKLICIFQPHRYSRTLEHYKGFAASLNLADEIYIANIYEANEKMIKGVSSQMIVDEILRLNPYKKTRLLPNFNTAIETLQKTIKPTSQKKPNGILLTMGAGNIYLLAKMLAKS